MDTILNLIEHYGTNFVISGLAVYLVFKYINKSMNKTSCVNSQIFQETRTKISEMKPTILEIQNKTNEIQHKITEIQYKTNELNASILEVKSLFQGFLYGNRYGGKNE